MCDITKPPPEERGIDKELNEYRRRSEEALRRNVYTVVAKPPYIFEVPKVVLATGIPYDEAMSMKARMQAEYERQNPGVSWCGMHFAIEPEGIYCCRVSKAEAQPGDFLAWPYEEPTKHEHVFTELWAYGVVKETANGKVVSYSTSTGLAQKLPSGALLIPASQLTDVPAATKAVEALEGRWHDQIPLLRCLAPFRRIVRHEEPESAFEAVLDKYGVAGMYRAFPDIPEAIERGRIAFAKKQEQWNALCESSQSA